MTRAAWLLVVALSSTGCGEEEPDLKQELRELTKDLRGRVDPLPRVLPNDAPVYGAARVPDPFYPAEKPRR